MPDQFELATMDATNRSANSNTTCLPLKGHAALLNHSNSLESNSSASTAVYPRLHSIQ
ncbi:uncharacterized protein RCO7_15148 [Rhynchosporium graminicola]|uniref:Uncharacterized protein n=1 Tax=Rhynchosporium graminicola TaxID=2792576 RepID=A0A1E1LMH5_9HELO|nr:uncharacterized protein RCO7_15148 [Rhynchosporium commune]